MIVFEQAVLQGTAISRSILLPDPLTRRFVGSVFESTPTYLIDPSFSMVIYLQAQEGYCSPWVQKAVWEWDTSKNPPSVHWDGVARRVRMIVDPIRSCSLGMAITY